MAERSPSAAKDGTRLMLEGEDVDGRTLVSALGDRRWKAEKVESGPLRAGLPRGDAVYALYPQGGDTYGFGGVKRLVRTEDELFARGWRVIA